MDACEIVECWEKSEEEAESNESCFFEESNEESAPEEGGDEATGFWDFDFNEELGGERVESFREEEELADSS